MKHLALLTLLLSACLSPAPNAEDSGVSANEQRILGCPFTKSNTLEFGARLRGWPLDAHASDCVLVANATELGAGSSFICSKGPQYARIFIPKQIASCTMESYVQGCGADGVPGCHGPWTHVYCDGHTQGACWTD